MAAEKGVSTARIALAYVLNQPLEIYALTGGRNEAEILDNVETAEFKLTVEELAWLEGTEAQVASGWWLVARGKEQGAKKSCFP